MDYKEFVKTYHLNLTPRQEAAVRTVRGPVLLLAVPGSGKTTVLVSRLGYMLTCCGIAAEEILTMTYTVAATGDMKRRFEAVFGPELAAGLEFRTINGVCSKIIRRYEQSRGREAFALVTDERVSGMILTELWRKVNQGGYPAESDIKSLRTAITYAKNMLLSGEEELKSVEDAPEHFPELFAEYKNIMRQRRLMDYDDQMQYALTILKRCPDLLAEFRGRWPYLCVDEAQDTSKIQHIIISLLAGESGNLFMVGDEDQSIYGFRAAWPEALVNFEQDHPGAKVLLLEQNFRSTPEIVAAADRFIVQNKQRHPKTMEAVRPSGAEVRAVEVKSRAAQYAYLEKVAEGCGRETAVLYRDNDCALPLIDALSRRGIPYRCRQVDSSFFTHRVILDLTDIIRFAIDLTDKNRFLGLYYKLNTYLRREEAMAAAAACPDGESILKWIDRKGKVNDYAAVSCRMAEANLKHLLKDNGADAVTRILDKLGYRDYLKKRSMDAGKAEILRAIGRQEPDPQGLLRRLDELQAIVSAGSVDPNSNFILSTVHSSKGLEYDRVYLMDVFDGMLPREAEKTDTDLKQQRLMEEERRIFYVGMTRAKNELNIFTFDRNGPASGFADAVFEKKKPEQVKKEAPKRYGILPLGKKPTLVKENTPYGTELKASDLHTGMRLHHADYGDGVLRQIDGDQLSIAFETENGGREMHRISFRKAKDNGRLRHAEAADKTKGTAGESTES